MTYLFLATSLVLTGVLIYAYRRNRYLNRLLQRTLSSNTSLKAGRMEAIARLRHTEETTANLVVKMAPLIEKTAWFTGMYYGYTIEQFQALENKRNANVDVARKAVHDIPVAVETAKATFFANSLPLEDAAQKENA